MGTTLNSEYELISLLCVNFGYSNLDSPEVTFNASMRVNSTGKLRKGIALEFL